jgi:protein-L-isoaspartate(D-aspartate) O-methyltransferase
MINWNETYASGRDYSRMKPDVFEGILEVANVNESGEALDIGCGTGELAVMLAKRGFSVTGVDLSEVALHAATTRAENAKVTDKTTFMVGDIADPKTTTKLADKKYDLITCKLVLAFIQDKDAVIVWVKSHLTENGAFVLITPVLHKGREYSPRLNNISVDYGQLTELLKKYFTEPTIVDKESFEEGMGEQITFVIR